MGITFDVTNTDPAGFIIVRASNSSAVYGIGDTPCSAVIPMLCIDSDGTPQPVPYNYSTAYQGWSYAHLQLTTPISGTLLTSEAAGDAICAQQFGTGWAMGEFHDGQAGGGVGWGFGGQPIGSFAASNFWTAISDQAANPWD